MKMHLRLGDISQPRPALHIFLPAEERPMASSDLQTLKTDSAQLDWEHRGWYAAQLNVAFVS